jgi:hypothetical protein
MEEFMPGRRLTSVPSPPGEPLTKPPLLTGPVVWLFVATLTFTALMTLVGKVNLFLAVGLPLLVAVVILTVIGIGRGTSTLYRDLITFLNRHANDQSQS